MQRILSSHIFLLIPEQPQKQRWKTQSTDDLHLEGQTLILSPRIEGFYSLCLQCSFLQGILLLPEQVRTKLQQTSIICLIQGEIILLIKFLSVAGKFLDTFTCLRAVAYLFIFVLEVRLHIYLPPKYILDLKNNTSPPFF